jgi:hypothetical protein
MEWKIAANCRQLIRQSERLYARVISWISTDSLAARAFMIALGIPAGATLWTLAASSILHKTQR